MDRTSDVEQAPPVESVEMLSPDCFYLVGRNVVERNYRTGKTRVLPPAEEAAFRRWYLREE